jgi:hypothetical protein
MRSTHFLAHFGKHRSYSVTIGIELRNPMSGWLVYRWDSLMVQF